MKTNASQLIPLAQFERTGRSQSICVGCSKQLQEIGALMDTGPQDGWLMKKADRLARENGESFSGRRKTKKEMKMKNHSLQSVFKSIAEEDLNLLNLLLLMGNYHFSTNHASSDTAGWYVLNQDGDVLPDLVIIDLI